MAFAALHRCFTDVVAKYCNDDSLIRQLYKEIADRYAEPHRYYHNFYHLQSLYQELLEVKDLVSDWDSTMLSMFYHDIIYRVMKHDNEEKSALLAQERLSSIGYPAARIEVCFQQIMATKGHSKSDNDDIDLFTDSDLSILGASPSAYQMYTVAIRKEYRVYPDVLYMPGRKKVLRHFLSMDRIYKTAIFYSRYERQARSNIANELEKL